MDDFEPLSTYWDHPVYGDWLVVFDGDVNDLADESNVACMLRAIQLHFQHLGAALPCEVFEEEDFRGVIVYPDAVEVLDYAQQLLREIEMEGVLSYDDFLQRVQFAMEDYWHHLPLSERIDLCRRQGEDLANVTRSMIRELDDGLHETIEEIVRHHYSG